MLLAFSFYDPARGLPSLMSRIDFAETTRRQVYFAALGRGPENAAIAADGAGFDGRRALASALNGPEFQKRIREIVLNAFPEKKRRIFVHIPKCAGTDLLITLQRHFAFLHHHLALPDYTNRGTLFGKLQTLAGELGMSDSIAISGHVPLRWYLDRHLVRFEDELFTTVRHPREILYSFVSYVLTRCVVYQGQGLPDVKSWLASVGMEDIEPDASPGYLAELGGRLLRSPTVTSRNMICHYLGLDTAASAIDAMVLTDIEITDTARYSAWRMQRFGFEPATRINPSRPLFTPALASAADRALIDEMIGEDMVVYEKVIGKLAAGDALSVRGRAFA